MLCTASSMRATKALMMRGAKALASLRICTDSPEPSFLGYGTCTCADILYACSQCFFNRLFIPVITYTEGVFLKYGGRAVKKALKVKKGPRKDPFEENWKMRGKSLEQKKQRKKKKVTRQWVCLYILVLLDFSLTVKAATLIFISGRGPAISSAKEGNQFFL